MRKAMYRMATGGTVCAFALVMMLCAPASAQDADELAACAKLEDPKARLACYDAASRRAPAPESAAEPAKPAQPPEAAQVMEAAEAQEPEQAAPLSDAVGKEQLPVEDPNEGPVRGTLTDCREGPTGKWYFYFDNGQVWEQRDNDRLRLRTCDFDVTISKDFFGYKMEMPNSGNKIRVARVK